MRAKILLLASPLPLRFIAALHAALHNAERELDSFLSPGDELAAEGLERMLSDVADGKGLVLLARMDEIAVGFGCVLIDDYHEPAYIEEVRRRAYVCSS